MRLFEESQSLSFAGLRVHFRVVEPEEEVKDRILILSSPLIGAFHWRKLLPELSDLGFLTVLADLPGFGRSPCDAPPDREVCANLLWGILDEVDATAGAPMSLWHLMAHGSACPVILRMAAHCPDSIRTQIHIAPTFSVNPVLSRQGGAERWYDTNVSSPHRFHRMVDHYAGYPLDDYVVDRMRAPLLRPGQRAALARHLRRATVPPGEGMGFSSTMAIVGGLDPLLDETRQKQIAQLLPDAEIHRVKSAGHFPMETHSKALRDYLRGWFRFNQ